MKSQMKSLMTGERVYTESQVKTILQIYGLNDEEIEELFQYVCFCEIQGCTELAEYEGWIGSGLIRKVNVCESHKKLLRGYKEDET